MILGKREVWGEGYIPPRILYREDASSKLDYFLKPVLEGARAHNLLLVGDYGTGKTVLSRSKLNELMAKVDKGFRYFYINCAEYARERKAVTLGRIITQCLRSDFVKVYPTLPHEYKLERFKGHVQRYDAVIIVLDEVDHYLVSNNDFEALAVLTTRSLPNTSLLLITNKFWVPDYFTKEIDYSIQDTFTKRLKTIGFSDYTEDELYGILLDRARIGFHDGTYADDVLDYIAHLSFIHGWRARGVISIAREAAELADDQGDTMLTHKHVDEIAEIMPQKELKEIIKKLDPPALNILLYLTKHKGEGMEEDVLSWFTERAEKDGVYSGRSRTTFFNALGRLKGMELVISDVRGKGRGMGQYALLRIPGKHFKLVHESFSELIEKQRVNEKQREGRVKLL